MAEPRFAAHKEVVEVFMEMKNAAAKDGFELSPFSGFRDFKTQLRIWNHKFIGKKPLYDVEGIERDFKVLSEEQIIRHILDWSALPGGSRHHWGTDIDVIDLAVMPEGYRPKLLPEEVREGGIFHPLHCWLDANIEKFHFFRPYKEYRGGMYPEPWQLSYAPISMQVIKDISVEILLAVTEEADLLGKDLVLPQISEIYNNHILNIDYPDEQ